MRGLRATVVATALCLLAATPSSAAPGGLEGSFGKGGWVRQSLGSDDAAAGVVRTADGKVVVAGTTVDRDRARAYLTRYLPNGRVDTSFGSRGVVKPSFGGESVASELDQLSDGRLVFVGMGASRGKDGIVVARFLANGKPDTSYGNGGWAHVRVGHDGFGIATDAATAPDGAVTVVGVTLSAGGFVSFVIRLLPDGKPDTLFAPNGTVVDLVPDGIVSAVALQPDGSLVIAGARVPEDGPMTPFVSRYLPNGTQDPTFGSALNGLSATVFTGLVRAPEGFFVAAGYGPSRGDGTGSVVGKVVRFLPTGMLDPTFGLGGSTAIPAGDATLLTAVGLDSQGRIVVAGASESRTGDVLVARFARTGQLDPAFGRDGVSVLGSTSLHEMAYDVDVASDGSVTIAGAVQAVRPKSAPLDSMVARLLP